MGRWLVRLGEDAYVEWSSAVDAPVSWVMTREEAITFRMSGDRGFAPAPRIEAEGAVRRADLFGHSIIDGPRFDDARAAVRTNRAGPDETELTLEQIAARYASPDAYEAWTP